MVAKSTEIGTAQQSHKPRERHFPGTDPFADITPQHLLSFVGGLLHHIPLMLATLGGRCGETRPQGMRLNSSGEKTACPRSAFDQRDGSMAEAHGADFATLRYRDEDRIALDAGKFEENAPSAEGDSQFDPSPSWTILDE